MSERLPFDSLPDVMHAIRESGADDLTAAQLVAQWLRENEAVVWELLRQTQGLDGPHTEG